MGLKQKYNAIPTKGKSNKNNNDKQDDSNDDNDNKNDEKKDTKQKDDEIMSMAEKMSKERLDYENFCVVYGNLDGYAVVDGGIKGLLVSCFSYASCYHPTSEKPFPKRKMNLGVVRSVDCCFVFYLIVRWIFNSCVKKCVKTKRRR